MATVADLPTPPATVQGSPKPGPTVTENAVPSAAPKPYEVPKINLVNRFIDQPRELNVVVIGAGIAGVLAGILLPAKVPGIKLTIYEKNEEVVSDNTEVPYKQQIVILTCCSGWYLV